MRSHVASEAHLVRAAMDLRYVGKLGRKIGEVMNAAWDAQVAGKFADHAGAEEWLRRYFAAQ